MLDDDAFALFDRVENCLCKRAHLCKRRLEPNVKVVGGRREKAAIVDVEDRQRTHVDAVVVVGQLEPRKHAFDQHALAGARFADYADQLIIGRKVHLRDLHAEIVHAVASSGREKDAVIVALLHSSGIRHG